MSALARVGVVLGAAVALAALFVVLRGRADEGGEGSRAAVTAAPQPAPVATATNSARARKPLAPRDPGVTVVRIAVRGARVAGGVKRVTVRRGERVLIAVSSDVTDHVHVHGYDLVRDVGPGSPARIRFRANIAGRFDVELEDRALQVAEVEVRP